MTDKNMLTGDIDKNNIIGSAIVSEKSNIIIADEIIYQFLGVIYSIPFIDYIHPDMRAKFAEELKNCSGVPFVSKCRRYDDSYTDVTLIIRKKNIGDNSYINIDIFCIAYMTKEYKNYLTSNIVFDKLVGLSDRVFFVYDNEKDIIKVYNGKKTFFEGSMSEYSRTMKQSALIADDYIQQFEQMCYAISEGNGDGFYMMQTKLFNEKGDNDFHPVYSSFSTIEFNSQVAYVTGFFTSAISAAAESYDINRADLDPLTGLLNKRAIKELAVEKLNTAKQTGELVTFVMIDLDNFKSINDTYGHMFGDTTLANVARIINASVGERGKVGRIGGDEFFIVLTGFEDGDYAIRPVLRSIRSHVEWYFKHKISDIKVTCSVGTATYPLDVDNYDDLFKLADHCLYVAKALGRNRFIIYTRSILGEPEDILKQGSIIQMDNYISQAEKSQHILDFIGRLNTVKKADFKTFLEKTFEELLHFYNCDIVRYYDINQKDAVIEKTRGNIKIQDCVMDMFESFRERLEDQGYISMGNMDNSKLNFPDFYAYAKSNDICSAFLCADADENNVPRGMYLFATYKRYQVWSAFDTSQLILLCKLIERLIHNK